MHGTSAIGINVIGFRGAILWLDPDADDISPVLAVVARFVNRTASIIAVPLYCLELVESNVKYLI